MRINPKLQISITGIGFLLLLSASCTEDPYNLNLDDTRLNPSDTITKNLKFKTYQIPPQVGWHTTLYVGENNGYRIPYSLFTLSDLTELNDTLITVDSAYFQLTIDSTRSDTIDYDIQFSIGYVEYDTSYSESGSNYSNISWLPIAEELFFSYFVEKDDTIATVDKIRFNIDTSLVNMLADTNSTNQIFILKSTDELSFIQAFYSRDDDSHYPFLKVFYHYPDTSSGDTEETIIDTSTFRLSSDVAIIEPLPINSLDSTYAYIGYGAGLRTVIKSDIDSVGIPKEAVIVEANLIMTVSGEESNLYYASKFSVRAYSLADSVVNWAWDDTLSEDIYSWDIYLSSSTIQDSILTLDVKNIVQSWIVGALENFGFGLLTVDSHSVFDYAAFYTNSEDDTVKWPYLEVLYEAP